MKLHLLLLFPSASALTSIRRLVEQNADALTGQLGADVDLSCTLSMAEDAETCESVSDATGSACVWCPVGADLGGCISQDIASLVNAAGIPHLHCGKQEDADVRLEDDKFFLELQACVTEGYNGDACLEQDSNCQYCVTKDDPTFGVCYSQEFVTEAKSVVEMAKAFDSDMESWGEVFDCEGTSEESLTVGSIADMTCITNGNPEVVFSADSPPLCADLKDASGNDCIVANIFGFMDICVSSTQNSVLDFILIQLDDMGIEDPMSIIMGASMSEGGEASIENEDGRLELFDDDQFVGNDVGYAADESDMAESEVAEFEDEYDVDDEEEEGNIYEEELDDAINKEEDEDEEAVYVEGLTVEEGPEIVVEFEDFVSDSPNDFLSSNEMVAGIMNKMEERKELEDESGK